MARIKVYTLGVHGFIRPQVGDALGLRPHIRQAKVLVAAATKTDAVRVLAERGFPNHSTRDPEFRIATGNNVDALAAAGLLNAPTVLVTPSVGSGGNGVVEMQPGGEPQRIGHIEGGFGVANVFVPEGERPL